MGATEEILGKFGLKYEDLRDEERVVLDKWLQVLERREIEITDVKDYIAAMLDAIEKELEDEPEFNYIFIFKVPNRQQIMLKARLRNYRMLLKFLTSREKAKKNIQEYINAITGNRTQV